MITMSYYLIRLKKRRSEGVCKGLKKGLFSEMIFFKKFFKKKSFGDIKILTAVFLYNLMVLNRMALSESRFEARNTEIDLLPPNIVLSGFRILMSLIVVRQKKAY